MKAQRNANRSQNSAPRTPQLETSPLPVVPEPKRKPRTRHGKIARLPYLERDMVNRMLQNNVPYSNIVGALDEHGIRVTERNVSNWKTRGGYGEWQVEEARAVEARLLPGQSPRVPAPERRGRTARSRSATRCHATLAVLCQNRN